MSLRHVDARCQPDQGPAGYTGCAACGAPAGPGVGYAVRGVLVTVLSDPALVATQPRDPACPPDWPLRPERFGVDLRLCPRCSQGDAPQETAR